MQVRILFGGTRLKFTTAILLLILGLQWLPPCSLSVLCCQLPQKQKDCYQKREHHFYRSILSYGFLCQNPRRNYLQNKESISVTRDKREKHYDPIVWPTKLNHQVKSKINKDFGTHLFRYLKFIFNYGKWMGFVPTVNLT